MTTLNDVGQVLQSAIEDRLETVVVVGFDRDGRLYIAASTDDAPEVVYLLSSATHRVLNGDYAA
jgi:hypothetical protein